MMEINCIRIVVAIHTIVAIIIGFLSTKFELWVATLIGIVALIVLGLLSKKLISAKSWFGNGLIIYIFIWFVSWVLFYNII
jgi:uncharacterized membrane protein AbrB (regulator of aidB expression)